MSSQSPMSDLQMSNHSRQIIHVDMDAFFASVEIKERPELKNHPVIIGGGKRGVVSTCCYKAREYGVKSAMPIYKAKELCSHAVFLTPNKDKYNQMFQEIKQIFLDYTPMVEPLSLDEAFLEVSGSINLFGSSIYIGKDIQTRIYRELDLTCSVGIGSNKFVAKIASDLKKPSGFTYVPPGQEANFLSILPVEKLWGVGKKTTDVLREFGYINIDDLQAARQEQLSFLSDKQSEQLIRLASGIDNREVTPNEPPKSIGQELTFKEDLTIGEELITYLLKFSEQVGGRLRRHGYVGKTVTVKIKDNHFQTTTKQKTVPATDKDEIIYNASKELLQEFNLAPSKYIRLAGVTVNNLLQKQTQQITIDDLDGQQDSLQTTLDDMRDKYGQQIIQRARLLPKDHQDDQES